ncbi:unnamed protein product [Symbiodinium sp. CCMP2592]|nr:unnamed protein product [Symbiodinium sp. CCMP2592]
MVHATLRRVDGEDAESLVDASFGWQTLESTGHFVWRGRTDRYIDPATLVPITWPHRTTLVYAGAGWQMLEWCVEWLELKDPVALLPCGMCDCITVLSMNQEEPGDFGVELDSGLSEHVNDSGLQAELELQDADEQMPEVPGQADPPKHEHAEQDSVITVNGVGLSMESTLGALRAGCKFLNLSQSGSKQRCFQRLQGYVQKERISSEVEVARQAEGDDAREPRMQFLPEPPSEEARLLHEITHLPYASWCPHCIAMKSVPDQHRAVPEGNAREHPTASFDLFYTGYDPTGKLESGPDDRGGDRDKLTCLIVHCNHTDAIAAIPLPDNSAASMKHAAVELVRFCQLLGHSEVELRCDQEPCMLQLQGLAMNARKRLGFRTRIRNPPIGAHQANGLAEKAVDVIRSLANVFLDAARHRYGIMIPVSHPLFAWSFVHAAWTYTRFKVKGGLTSYERITGCRYRGKLVPYAEPIFAYIRTANSPKGNPKWVQAVFLSKSGINDMFIVGTSSGIMLSKSVRRTGQPWSTQKTLAEAIAGAPWNFQLGSLGLKTVPQGRIRAPNPAEQAAVVDGSAPELPLPPEVPLPLPSAPLNAEAGGIGDRAGLMAHGADEEPGPAPASKRATLLLSRGDRTPATPSAVTPGAMPSSVSVQAQHESPLPRVPDEAMLEVFLPKRSAGTGDGGEESPSKTARLRRVANEHLAVNDEELEVPSEWDDLDFSSKGDAVATSGGLSVGQTANTVEHEWDASPLPPETAQQAGILSDDELKALEAQLWFPEEPTLSPDEQAKVDAIADRFEVQRLIRKRVLKCAGLRGEVSEEGFKRLSTKFVRTWRKKVKGGVEMVLRRSRLCAREYKWLEADRLDIFSPASNTAVSKLLPWLFARMKNEPGASAGDDRPSMLTLDVKNAYLTVPQAEKVRASMPRDYSDQFEYDFEMCIPGQRDGALRWRERLINYLRTKFEVKVCEACPALISIDGQNCLLHVDDLFIVGKRSWLLKHFVPALEKEFECSWTIASEEGESVSFLKRTHRVTESGVIVQAQSDLIHKMCEVLGLHERKTSAVPCSKDILKVSGSKLLDAEGGSTFRTAIGIAMYLSNDRVDCAFPIRTLAQRLTAPTEDDLKAARKLAAYLRHTAGFGIHIVPREKGYSFLDQGPSRDQHEHLLEVCSDSDWSGSQVSRRSMSSAVHFLDGATVFSSCRGQKVVSLSSCEAEHYASVTAACDGLYLSQCLTFILGEKPRITIRLDNQTARQLAHRSGPSSKTRHIDARLFWVQEKVQNKLLSYMPVSGHINPSDLGTKVLSERRFRAMLGAQNFVDTANSDVAVGLDEWSDLLSESGIHVRLRRLHAQLRSVRSSRAARAQTMMIGCLLAATRGGLDELPW